jgi:hypothetical protein
MPTSAKLRNDLTGLTRLAQGDLNVIWRRVEAAEQAARPLESVLPALVDAYGVAAATVAAEWYDQLRAEKRVTRAFVARPARIDNTGTQALVGWARSEATDFAAFRSLIEGGMQRRILNFSRLTLTESAVDDPAASGWQRVGAGECEFCALLIGRGAVYSEASADFASHDNCRCFAEPAFEGLPRPVQPYTPSQRNISDADRARVREYIAGHDL